MKPPKNATLIEMLDGRIFWSTDSFFTVRQSGRERPITGRQADLIRFLAAAQAGNAHYWNEPGKGKTR